MIQQASMVGRQCIRNETVGTSNRDRQGRCILFGQTQYVGREPTSTRECHEKPNYRLEEARALKMEALNGYHAKQCFGTKLEINDGSKDGCNKAELQHRFPNAASIQFFPGTVSQHCAQPRLHIAQ